MIHFSQEYEQFVHNIMLSARESGEWGRYNSLSLKDKYAICLHRCWGCVGKLLAYFGVVFYDLGFGGGGMQYSHFLFVLVVGPHPGAKPKAGKASK